MSFTPFFSVVWLHSITSLFWAKVLPHKREKWHTHPKAQKTKKSVATAVPIGGFGGLGFGVIPNCAVLERSGSTAHRIKTGMVC